MVVNPFVRLFEAPVETLTLAAYCLGLLALVWITLTTCWSNALTAYVQFEKQRPTQWRYKPPIAWTVRVGSILLVLMLDVFAVAAFIDLTT